MLRDSLKDKEYFDNYIIERIEIIEEDKKRLKNNEIKANRFSVEQIRASVANGMYTDSIRLIYAMYSRGDSFEDIKEAFIKILLDSYYIASEENGIDYVHFDPYFDFSHLMPTMSFLILFEIRGEDLKKSLDILKDAPPYQIVNRYLACLGLHREEIKEEHKLEKAFSKLNEMFTLSNEEIIKNKLMNKYLKTWYNNEARVSGKGLHEDKYKGYFYHGYWAFEVAAFVKARGLDDSSFRDNIYYPKDLVDFSRALK